MRLKAGALLLLALLVITVGASACASAGSTGMRDYNPDRISPVEISQARDEGIHNLEELIQNTRPQWLRSDRIQSFNVGSSILVFEGESLVGGVEVLRELPLEAVAELRWLDSAQAGTLPGAGGDHVEGAIVIRRN